MPLDQAVLDYQPARRRRDRPRARARASLVVAARRDMIDRLLERRPPRRPAPRGHRPLRVRDDPRAAPPRPPDRGAAWCSTSAAGGLTNLAVADGSRCLFTRVASNGVEGMVAQLAERRELTLDHARQWLTHVGLTDARRRGRRRSRDRGRGAHRAQRGRAQDRRRASATRSSSTAPGGAAPVERAVLTGPGASIPGFVRRARPACSAFPSRPAAVVEARPGALRRDRRRDA